jgi:cold shock protein
MGTLGFQQVYQRVQSSAVNPNETRGNQMATTLIGTIRKLITPRGFGFIVSGDREFFLHYSKVIDGSWPGLQEGSVVTFDYVETPKGLQAERVRRAVLPTEVATDGTRN